MAITASVLLTLALRIVAPWVARVAPRAAGWLLGAGLVVAAVPLLSLAPSVLDGHPAREAIDWAPAIGLRFSLVLDGLSLLLAVLILGIGALVAVYAGAYLAGDARLPRFFATLLLFAGAMLGLVLADNVLLLYVFWALTGLTSYLLIGHDHELERPRASALQALIVTFAGELAMLAGLLLLARAGGSTELSQLILRGDRIAADPLFGPIVVLLVIGALTKSAQFPFHFWLPNAMDAPTPVSAYLHSATMVKAGVYLLARLHPALSGSELWTPLVAGVGVATMLLGGLLALRQHDAKRLLAYSTVGALGLMVFMLGVGTPLAAEAALEPFKDVAAHAHTSAAEVARHSDVVITMVADAPDVRDVTLGVDGIAEGAKKGLIVVDMSTIDPIATRAFAERLADYPVRIGALSRFRTPREQADLLAALAEGRIEIEPKRRPIRIVKKGRLQVAASVETGETLTRATVEKTGERS